MRREDISGPVVFLVVGSVLRLIWPADMEWKGDEIWMVARAISVAHSGVLPWLGMGSGVHILNPGFSIWPFALFARFAEDPVAMVQWVQWSNVIALWAFFWLVIRAVPADTRSVWLWGLALFAVNPLAVLYSRKLWAQDILPIFGAAILWGHFYRRTRIGAFAWGLAGALMGQVHMSGFFFAFALALGTVVRDSRRGELRATRWTYWIVGSLIGGAILLPWLNALTAGHAGHPPYHWREVLTVNFYAQWFLNAWGIGLAATRFGGIQFLREPLLRGHPTYLVLFAHAYLAGVGLWITLRWLVRGLRPRFDEQLAFYVAVTLGLVGVLLTLSGVRVRPHYLIVVSPFVQLWAAGVTWPRRRLLVSVAATQMLVSAVLLAVVHREGGMPWADYGSSYRAQRAAGASNVVPPAK